MQKTEPLVTNRRVLTWLCVYPSERTTTKSQQLAYLAFSFIVFTGILSSLIASVAFFIKHVSTDLEVALYAVSQIAAAASILYAILMTYFQRRGIATIFQQLAAIYERS